MKLKKIHAGNYRIGITNWYIRRTYYDTEVPLKGQGGWDVVEERGGERYAEGIIFGSIRKAKDHFLKEILGKK